MGFHGFDAGFHVGMAFHLIFTKTWLQETMLGHNILILRQILTKIDHLQFIAMLQNTRFQIATLKG